ncbi:monoacylglycerol lipase ABHD2-like [Ptychodera flava]|uniref:monoacylglycerol lipase ABHD2-like n=1 Tax=Ptychodera flava TaxID=63121 RepID=UPI00396A4748
MADAVFYFVVLVIIYVLVRILHSNSNAEKPKLYYRDSKLVREIIKMCPAMTDLYTPTLLWGKSGHLQTFVYAKLGRVQPPFLRGFRRSVMMSDGATCTFDVFEPEQPHQTQDDYTICIAPGIANSSESKYIRTFVNCACNHGYRVGVLNHLGALKNVPLTSPRIFTWGETDEYNAMVTYFEERHPTTRFIAIGFSMGGNIVLKYLGEDVTRQEKFVCGVSLCQGYDISFGVEAMHQWEKLRRIYNFLMTENQKSVIKRNRDMLFGSGAKLYYQREGKKPTEYDLDKVFEATSLVHIDEHFTRKMAGYNSLEEFFCTCSSKFYIPNIEIPLMILNAEDDPLIPNAVFDIPKKHVETVNNSIFVVTKHGGHLGFFEGGVVRPNPVTWLDRMVVEYVDAIIDVTQRNEELSD